MDMCEQCAHYVADEEYGDYCGVSLDEDEMEKCRELPVFSALRRV